MDLIHDFLTQDNQLESDLEAACSELDLITVESLLTNASQSVIDNTLNSIMIQYEINLRKDYKTKKVIIGKLIEKGADYSIILTHVRATLDVIKFLIDAGADPHATCYGANALHGAVLMPKNHEKITYCMHELGCDINGIETRLNGNTPLQSIIANENIEQATFYIDETLKLQQDRQLDFTIQDKEGKTSLLLACKIRSLPIVTKILQAANKPGVKLNVNLPDNKGRTPLHFACLYGHKEMVEALLTAGADTNKKDSKGLTCYDYLNLPMEEVIKALNEIDINPDRDVNANKNLITGSDFRQPLILPDLGGEYEILASKRSKARINTAISQLNQFRSASYREGLTRRLQLNGTDKITVDTILSQSAAYIRKQFKSYSGISIAKACMQGRYECNDILKAHKPSVNCDTQRESQKLEVQVTSSSPADKLKQLLNKGQWSLLYGHIEQHPNLITKQLDKKAKRSLIHKVVSKNGADKFLQRLISLNSDIINSTDKKQDTALHIAIKNARFSSALVLIELGANATLTNSEKQTPLMLLEKINKPSFPEQLGTYNQLHLKLKILQKELRPTATDETIDDEHRLGSSVTRLAC